MMLLPSIRTPSVLVCVPFVESASVAFQAAFLAATATYGLVTIALVQLAHQVLSVGHAPADVLQHVFSVGHAPFPQRASSVRQALLAWSGPLVLFLES